MLDISAFNRSYRFVTIQSFFLCTVTTPYKIDLSVQTVKSGKRCFMNIISNSYYDKQSNCRIKHRKKRSLSHFYPLRALKLNLFVIRQRTHVAFRSYML